MTAELDDLPALETSLWRSDSRFDRGLMEETFAADFFEFGRSGRRYARAELIFDREAWQELDATLHDLAVRPLAADIALCSYVSEVRFPEGTEWGNRASIWDRSEGRWRLRFHQGTPCPALP